METITFDELAKLAVFHKFYSLAYRLFGVCIALIRPGDREGIVLGPKESLNPFCRYLHTNDYARSRCVDCDTAHQQECRKSKHWIRYRCHAGLTEFIIPIMVNRELIAFLQCGQVLDHPATPADRRYVDALAFQHKRDADRLWRLYRRSRVVSQSTQETLIELLELFANYLADAGTRLLLLEKGRTSQIVSLAEAHIRDHLTDDLSLSAIARAAHTSLRNLVRLFKKETGATVVERTNRLRADRACELLLRLDKPISTVAMESGFGSVQHFNRVFKRCHGSSPKAWRRKNSG